MEETIANLCKTLAYFCNHLDNSCEALKQSVQRRPIPLDSASTTFIQCLNRRVSAVTSDLNLLDSMSFGTVSFEELLGHCNEVYKTNETHLLQLHDRLKTFNNIPEFEIDDEDKGCSLLTPIGFDSKDEVESPSPISFSHSVMKSLEEDTLLDESLSLKNLGLSDVCLATLASEDNDNTDDPDWCFQETMKDKLHEIKDLSEQTANIEGELKDKPISFEAAGPVIKVSKDDYDSIPSYMKTLTSWEDLLIAVEKINSNLRKEKTKQCNYFQQDEIASLDLGHKARAYLLLLTRLNCLRIETIDGRISYRVL
ncbi:uncharacterized protein LOC123227115 isoform X2 [Mangifera indica]|uniref:uncharacterized protein LOC123227115 isoform X2 n=1 Tax=Mangifera indica TaxID=29780 RepID=UPI001CFA697E|nr:uncharacterized protein LOC123227115 isoform X2 [Mangifera indica]